MSTIGLALAKRVGFGHQPVTYVTDSDWLALRMFTGFLAELLPASVGCVPEGADVEELLQIALILHVENDVLGAFDLRVR
jgi:hypothetical protein